MRAMLGTIDRGHVVRIAECLADGDGAGAASRRCAALDEQAPDYDQVLAELAALLERLALEQVVPDAGTEAGLDSSQLLRARRAPATPRTCSSTTRSRSSVGATSASRPSRGSASR